MDDGLIQFLVVAAFVVFSLIDGAARKKKRAAASEAVGHPEEELGPGDVRPEDLRPQGTLSTTIQAWEELAQPQQVGWGEERSPTSPVLHEPAGHEVGQPLIEESYPADAATLYEVRRDETSVDSYGPTAVGPDELEVRPHDDEPPHVHPIEPDVWDLGGDLAAQVPSSGRMAPARKKSNGWLDIIHDQHGVAGLRRAIVIREIFGPPLSLRNAGSASGAGEWP